MKSKTKYSALFFLLITLGFSAFSKRQAVEEVNIKNMNFQYRDNEGRGHADLFELPSPEIEPKMRVLLSVIEQGGGFFISYGEKDYFWESPPLFLINTDYIDLNNFGMSFNSNSIKVKANNFKSISSDSGSEIKTLSLDCSLGKGEHHFELILASCLKKSTTRLGRGVFTKSTGKILQEAIFEQAFTSLGSDKTVLEDLKIDINKNAFKLSGSIDVGMSASVKISGKSWYLPEERVVKIKIEKAKASFFNIKKRIFKALKEKESETFKVERPYLYLITD